MTTTEMTTTGRTESTGRWLATTYRASLGALVLAVVGGIAVGQFLYATRWSDRQRYFLPVFVKASVHAAFGMQSASYPLLELVKRDRSGERVTALPLDEDVVALRPEEGEGFAMSRAAAEDGWVALVTVTERRECEAMRDYLAEWVYGGQRLVALSSPVWITSSTLAVAFLWFAWPHDRKRAREARLGRRSRGTVVAETPKDFNDIIDGDGFGFGMGTKGKGGVRIPYKAHPLHTLIVGATGSGKSQATQEVMRQVIAAGHGAIVFDPPRELLERFWQEGDSIVNFADLRSMGWIPGAEVTNEMEGLAVAQALFATRPGRKEFFDTTATRLLAFLLGLRPIVPNQPDPTVTAPVTAAQLIEWMRDGDKLDELVKGTVHESAIDKGAMPQRLGLLASLGEVADMLQMIPPEHEWQGVFCAREWAKTRRGRVWLTSTNSTRARLIPIQTLLLDLLAMRLLEDDSPSKRPVWMILDELPVANRIPKLPELLAEARKAGVCILATLQGKRQLIPRYGDEAGTMLAQFGTVIVMKTSGDEDAKWASDILGSVETEYRTESRDGGGLGRQKSRWSMTRHTEPVAMPSQIAGLKPLEGYLKHEGVVVKMAWPLVVMPAKYPRLIERDLAERRILSPSGTPGPSVDETETIVVLDEAQEMATELSASVDA
jgi:hypothetical protein